MSSNIEIRRICAWCKQEFIAHKTTTTCCSHRCANLLYKQKKREASIKANNQIVEKVIKEKPIEKIRDKPILTITEAATYIGVTRPTLYGYLKRGELKASRLGYKFLLKKEDIDNLFNKPIEFKIPVRDKPSINDFYTTAEVKEKYGVKDSWIFHIAKEHNIPRTFHRGKTYWSKKHIDDYFAKKAPDPEIKEWYSITDYTGEDTSDFIYDGDVYALPVSEDIKPAELVQIKLEPYNRQINLFTIPDELSNSEAILFSGPESSRRLIPKYYNFRQEDYSLEVRGEMSAANTKLWGERLSKDNVFAGEYWEKTVKAFRIISEFNLPFTTYNAFKAIGRDPKLLVNLILACWLNRASDILIQEIDRLEDELNIAVHWIPHTAWEECIESFISSLPPALISIMNAKLGEITELINGLFSATLSSEVASELTQYVVGGNIGYARIFSRADINQFKSKIHGCTDNNIDLPLTRFVLQNKYYVEQEMHKSYRVMIEAAMCAAENLTQVKDCINLFSLENQDYARIINFYRKYFKETYSEIFIGTVKQIVNK